MADDDHQYPPFTTVERMSNRITRIPGLNPGKWTLNGTNTYLVGTGNRRILIDCGTLEKTEGYTKLLAQTLDKHQCEISTVLLTHGHEDHYGGVPAVLDLCLQRTHLTPPVFRVTTSRQIVPTLPAPYSYTSLTDGQVFECEGATLKTYFTPGHCPDHTAFMLQQEKALFSGDCILGDTDTTFDDLFDYIKAVQKMITLAPSVLYPGHGNVVQRPMTKLEGTVRVKLKESNEILALLENHHPQALTAAEITQKMYKLTNPKDVERYRKYVQQHVVRLLRLTRITKRVVAEQERFLYMFGAA